MIVEPHPPRGARKSLADYPKDNKDVNTDTMGQLYHLNTHSQG